MKHHIIGLPIAAATLALIANATMAATVTFETVPLDSSGYWNGSDLSGTPGTEMFGETPYTQIKNVEGAGFKNVFTGWATSAVLIASHAGRSSRNCRYRLSCSM